MRGTRYPVSMRCNTFGQLTRHTPLAHHDGQEISSIDSKYNPVYHLENEETAIIYDLCQARRHLCSIATSSDLASQNTTGPCMDIESRA